MASRDVALALALWLSPTGVPAQDAPEPLDQLEALRGELSRLEQSWQEATGEARQLYYVLLHRRAQEFEELLGSLTPDPPGAAPEPLRQTLIAALEEQRDWLSQWVTAQSTGIEALRDQLNSAEPDRALEIEHLLTATNDALDRLLTAQVTNLERLRALGASPDATALDARLRRRAELDAARIYRTVSLLEVAQAGAARATGDGQSAAETQVAVLREKLAGTSGSLETLAGLLERRGMNVAPYRELLLETTGHLTVETLDREVALTALERFSTAARTWVAENWAGGTFNAVVFTLILFLGWTLAGLVRRLLERLFSRGQENRSRLLASFVSRTAAKVVVGPAILVALSQVGIELAPFLAGLGVAGIVLGLALQDTLSNLFSGFMILIHGPYDVDDVVEAGGVSGTVHAMNLVTTTILTFDNKKLIVPNKKIWADTIQNVGAQRLRRVDLEIGVSYSDDVDRVETFLREMVTEHPKVLEDPAPNVRMHRLDDSAVTFIVRPWVLSADYWSVYWELLKAFKQRFDAEGISIPFPQRDVHIIAPKDAEAPAAPRPEPDEPPPAPDPAGEDAPGDID